MKRSVIFLSLVIILNLVMSACTAAVPAAAFNQAIPSTVPTKPAATVAAKSDVAIATATTQAEPQPELEGKLVKLSDGYLVVAAIKRDANIQRAHYTFSYNKQPARLTDATGAEIPIESVDLSDGYDEVFKDDWVDIILFRTRTQKIIAPMTLTFPTLIREMINFGKEADFKVDLGKDIQTGKKIPFQNNLNFISGHSFTLKEISIDILEPNNPNKLHTVFFFEGKGFEGIVVGQTNLPPLPPGMGGGGGSNGDTCDENFPGCFYAETDLVMSPEGSYPLHVDDVRFAVDGPWSLSFNPADADIAK